MPIEVAGPDAHVLCLGAAGALPSLPRTRTIEAGAQPEASFWKVLRSLGDSIFDLIVVGKGVSEGVVREVASMRGRRSARLFVVQRSGGDQRLSRDLHACIVDPAGAGFEATVRALLTPTLVPGLVGFDAADLIFLARPPCTGTAVRPGEPAPADTNSLYASMIMGPRGTLADVNVAAEWWGLRLPAEADFIFGATCDAVDRPDEFVAIALRREP